MLTMTISKKIRFSNTLCLLLLVLTNMCAYTAHAKDAESNVLRIDGEYSAELQFCNESGKGQAFESGTTIYYLYPTKDGRYSVEYDKYADSISCDANYTLKSAKNLVLDVLTEFWPIPGKADQHATYRDTTVTRDMRPFITRDNEKIMKAIGFSSDVRQWQITDTYLPSGQLGSMVQQSEFIGNGVNFRRIFGAVPTECRATIHVTIRSVKTLDAKEAKTIRKAERKEYHKER